MNFRLPRTQEILVPAMIHHLHETSIGRQTPHLKPHQGGIK
jgi:hypothetical protein